jgi:hypothetical protein
MFEYDGIMSGSSLAAAHQLLEQAVAQLAAAAGPAAGDDELLAVLTECEAAGRRLERLSVGAIADLERRGVFAERGYRNTVTAVADLLGWDRYEARRQLVVTEQVCERVALDGTALPARLGATAEVFAAGDCSARQVEVVAKVLASPAARRLAPDGWAAAEEQLAARAGGYSPADLHAWGTALVEALDADGAEPDEREPAPVNELFLTRNPNGSGGKRKGRIDDPAMYDAIATVIDAGARPNTGDHDRPLGQRQAEALADACGYVLDHGDVPECGGERPHLNVTVRLEDLENRARAACLDFGGTLTPEQLRCCAATREWCRSCWTERASHWTSAGPPAPSPTGCAAPSLPATAAAPAAGDRPAGRRSTTSSRRNTAAPPRWTTAPWSAAPATA